MHFWDKLYYYVNFPLIKLGESQITAWTIAYILLLLVILYTITNRMKHLVVDRLFAKSHIEYGTRQAIGTIVAYSIVLIGTLVILDSAGINLSALTIVAGALGIGIGFGLQNVTTNFISGIIVLLERPIKVGDRVQVEGATGDVIKISLRATTILTNDNIAVIVPNSEFVSSKVINWSHRNPDVRCNFPISVAYGTDPELVRDVLLEIAENHPGVLKDKKPDVLLDEFGDSSLNFILRVWTRAYTSKPGVLRSEINYEITKKFEQHGIQIPFPQREVFLRGGEIKVMPD
ncbi:mechanosensitive ion channel [bacterium]|nr:mechanosensitive ion channel [bacterium]